MSNPIHGPHDPNKVKPVQRPSGTYEEKDQQTIENQKDEGVVALLLYYLKRTVDFFLEQKFAPKPKAKYIGNHLILLKNGLTTLQNEDRSRDKEFLGTLSIVWQDFLAEAPLVQKTLAAKKIKELIDSVQSFPIGSTDTVGFYFSECAYQKEIPLPFQELIQKIHKEHTSLSGTSMLTRWITLIDEISILLQDD